MRELQRHRLQLESRSGTGAQEWYCPACGRRLAVQLPAGSEILAIDRGESYVLAWGAAIGMAAATKIVLEPGDQSAIHHGRLAPGIVSPDFAAAPVLNESESTDVSEAVDPAEEPEYMERLDVWQEYLQDIDLDL